MMSDAASIRPVEYFLGAAEASGGPFALLGLPAADVGDQIVLGALERQLGRISGHREGDTPAADEVRLALHASAAQLLDDRVRRQLVVLWGGRLDESPAPRSAVNAGLTKRPLEHDAILTLGMFGGWNRRSLRRILQLAHARGMDNHEVAATLARLARGRARPGRVRPSRPKSPEERAKAKADAEAIAEQQDPMVGILKLTAAMSALVVVLLAGALIVINLVVQEPTDVEQPVVQAPPPVTDRGSIFNQTQSAPKNPGDAAEAPVKDAVKPDEIAIRLQKAIEALAYDAGPSKADFLGAVETLSRTWASLPTGDLIASNQRVVEYVYRTSTRTELSRDVIEAVASGAKALESDVISPEQVFVSTWSVGMLARLSRERDLSAMAEGLIRRYLGDAIGHTSSVATFDRGAASVFASLAERLATGKDGASRDRMDAWSNWLVGVGAVSTETDFDTMVLAAIETILTRGPEPTSDKATFEAIGLLISKLDWTQDGQARAWLVRWFADRRVSSDDLHAVTMALVTRTRTPGITQLMTLSAAASDRQRSDVREQYVVTWGLGESVRMEGLLADWAREARAVLSQAPQDSGAQLEQAVRLSRLNEAASLLWRGHSADADALLEGLELPLETLRAQAENRQPAAAAQAAGVAPNPDNEVTDGRWGLRYLQAARNIPLREKLLNDMIRRTGLIGAVDAEVLAHEAIYGSPREIREKAREVSLIYSNDPDMVNGVLEALPRARRDADTDDFLQRMSLAPLPPLRSPDWPAAARRALVERLLELTAATGEYAWVDALSDQLAASYENRASAQPIPDEIPLSRTPPEAGESAEALWHVWLASADQSRAVRPAGASVEELSRRRAGRASLAQGLVQRFAAQQVSVCELSAFVVASERPGASPAIELIMAELADRRRRAGHIFTQLEATERAMLKLWLLRLTEGQV